MASSQWKSFQSPKQEGGSYQRSSSFSKSSNNSHSPPNSSSALREAGIIEKLLHSYGFIQCCEKQARLFFHYSQFCGNIDFLKVGDAVEFETAYDRKTGKPIARDVLKIAPESFSGDSLHDERVSGIVTTEIKNGNEQGRIAYENRGECFFLPYSTEDVDPGTTQLQPGDKVTFLIVTDKQNGNPLAQNVRLEKPTPEKHQGVICTLKETFGFIERADVVKEIFFHSSECKDFKNLNLGDDVEFFIQIRNNKEVATNVICLPLGTVVFEDISPETIMGQVIKVIDRFQSRQANDPLPGRIRYRRDNKFGDLATGSLNTTGDDHQLQMEIQFGDKDCKGDYTLKEGDWVQFNLAVDKRDKLQRATHIELMLDESFAVSGEKREQGLIAAVKDNFGFIKYGNRDNRLYFRYSEVVDNDQFKVNDEVEFTVIQDPASPNRYQAVRIRMLPLGTVQLDQSMDGEGGNRKSRNIGVIEKEARPNKKADKFFSSQSASNRNNREEGGGSDGIITYQLNGESRKITYSLKDLVEARTYPKQGEKVEFKMSSPEGENAYATEVRLLHHGTRNGFAYTHQGFIAALKDSFGFIENEEHEKEIFFHFSTFDGNPSNLELGQEVEYGISTKGNKVSAECVRKLPQGSIPGELPLPDIMSGIILRPVRCFNPEQKEYCGMIQVSNTSCAGSEDEQNGVGEDEDGEQMCSGGTLEEPQQVGFGITSLVDKHDLLQKGDVVQFQLTTNAKTGKEWAVNIKALRTKLQAVVEAIRGSFGFLSHEVEEGKKLFFHMSEVKNGETLQPGDKVEFTLMHNQRTGKYSACGVLKIGESQPSQRPERLVSRLRTVSMDDNMPKMIVIRQPRGPDGTDGFKNQRTSSFCAIPENEVGLAFSAGDYDEVKQHLETIPVVEVVPNGELSQTLSQ